MSFVKHIPCPKCGSRDNRAVYTDGSEWCFGCHDLKRPKQYSREKPEEKKVSPLALVGDIPEPNLSWLRSCLTDDQIEQYFQWAPSLERHVYVEMKYATDRDCDGEVAFWEARKVPKENETIRDESKVISSGHKPFSIWGKWKETGVVVIVEDIVSAIKLSDLVGVLCLHGSTMPWGVYQRLGNIFTIKKVFIWLDADKLSASRGMYARLVSWAKEVSIIRTPQDPKKYSIEELKEILKDAV